MIATAAVGVDGDIRATDLASVVVSLSNRGRCQRLVAVAKVRMAVTADDQVDRFAGGVQFGCQGLITIDGMP